MNSKKVKSYESDTKAMPALKRRQALRSRLDDIEYLKARNLTDGDIK
ncbi:hypothetical protein [Aeromonas sp. SCS5]|nr:hypothetical protein [Aeromonas sp. SCS5]